MRVADYLNRVPDVAAQRVTAAARPGEHLEQYFSGRQVRDRAASDYVLFDGASIQRRIRPHEWEAAWQEYRHRRPAMVVSFDGVEVFWLYARPAAVSWRNARSEVQPVSEEHGWNGWVPVAWLWSMALAAGTWWVVRNAAR